MRSIKHLPALLCALLIPACMAPEEDLGEDLGESTQATAGSGSTSKLLGRGTYTPFAITRETDTWEIEAAAKANTDVAVQEISFPAGAHSGWHAHPGPVFITVVEGEMTFYDSGDPDCAPVVKGPGQGFLDGGGAHAHAARNESGGPSKNIVVYLAAQAAVLRVDMPVPTNPNCPTL